MLTTLLSKYKAVAASLLLVAFAIYPIFILDWWGYPGGRSEELRCYSPNHEYYIVRLQTPFNALVADSVHVSGTAKLYDKSGTMLYQGETLLSAQFGPEWGVGLGRAGDKYSVFFLGRDDGEEWGVELPTSPGDPSPLKKCH